MRRGVCRMVLALIRGSRDPNSGCRREQARRNRAGMVICMACMRLLGFRVMMIFLLGESFLASNQEGVILIDTAQIAPEGRMGLLAERTNVKA